MFRGVCLTPEIRPFANVPPHTPECLVGTKYRRGIDLSHFLVQPSLLGNENSYTLKLLFLFNWLDAQAHVTDSPFRNVNIGIIRSWFPQTVIGGSANFHISEVGSALPRFCPGRSTGYAPTARTLIPS